jgi:hypothetical protein
MIKHECRIRMIFVAQASLDGAITEYGLHYHQERNHQSATISYPALLG